MVYLKTLEHAETEKEKQKEKERVTVLMIMMNTEMLILISMAAPLEHKERLVRKEINQEMLIMTVRHSLCSS